MHANDTPVAIYRVDYEDTHWAQAFLHGVKACESHFISADI